jgi:hypothetical protein
MVWGIVRDADDEDTRLFLPVKCNICQRPPGLAFRIQERASVAWESGEVTTTIDTAMSKLAEKDRDGGKLEEACEWLRSRLADGKEVESEALMDEAMKVGTSSRTHIRAKKEIGVKSRKGRSEEGSKWFVSLPRVNGHDGQDGFLGNRGILGNLTTQHCQHGQEDQEYQEDQQCQTIYERTGL